MTTILPKTIENLDKNVWILNGLVIVIRYKQCMTSTQDLVGIHWSEYTTTQHTKSWSKYTTDELKSEKLI